MQINELTGLPELPEGYFWRVQEYTRNPYIMQFAAQNSYGFFVELVMKTTLIKPTIKSFLLFEWQSGTYEEAKETIIVSENLQSGKNEILLENVTESLILKAAEKAYERWEQMERGRSLLGDYPPKKLTVVTDDEGK